MLQIAKQTQEAARPNPAQHRGLGQLPLGACQHTDLVEAVDGLDDAARGHHRLPVPEPVRLEPVRAPCRTAQYPHTSMLFTPQHSCFRTAPSSCTSHKQRASTHKRKDDNHPHTNTLVQTSTTEHSCRCVCIYLLRTPTLACSRAAPRVHRVAGPEAVCDRPSARARRGVELGGEDGEEVAVHELRAVQVVVGHA
eukprot:340583-Rhodomonas_salina.2